MATTATGLVFRRNTTTHHHRPQGPNPLRTVVGSLATHQHLIHPDNDLQHNHTAVRRLKRLNDEFEIGTSSWQARLMNFPEFVMLVRHRAASSVYLLVISIFTVTNLDGLVAVPVWVRFAIYTAKLLVFMVTFVAVTKWRLLHYRKAGVPYLHPSPLILISVASVLAIHQITYLMLTGAIWPLTRIVAVYIFYWISAEVTIHLFGWLVMPYALDDLRGTAHPGRTAPIRVFFARLAALLSPDLTAFAVPPITAGPRPAPQNANIDILGKSVPLAQLDHIRAEGNYVHLRGEGIELTVLGRFSAALAKVPSDLGRQVHRSHWVAQAAVAGFHATKDELTIVLHDGTEVPVAGPRRAEVLPWLHQFCGPLS
ncbi:MAG: LytTR family transcriptional regulator [Rhodobacteraceae bacterium]|nr:LytTR family transcriptional regulator [Paracoccaceae bacterium]